MCEMCCENSMDYYKVTDICMHVPLDLDLIAQMYCDVRKQYVNFNENVASIIIIIFYILYMLYMLRDLSSN